MMTVPLGETEGEEARIYMYTDKAFGLEGPASLYICRATQGLTKAPPAIQWSINGEVITDDLEGFKVSNACFTHSPLALSLSLPHFLCTHSLFLLSHF